MAAAAVVVPTFLKALMRVLELEYVNAGLDSHRSML